MQELMKHIRPVAKEDIGKLPVFSYSKIEVFKNCPMQYKIKYIDKKMSSDTTLALELGSICHYVLEQKGKALVDNKPVDYNLLHTILYEGVTNTDEKTKEALLGVKALKRKYFDKWYDKASPDENNYEDKMKIFEDVVHSEMEDDDWTPTYFERSFDFVWDNKYILHGFIDRVDTKIVLNDKGEKITEYRVIDYKTSKKIFDEKKLPTALQFGIYALAILNDFGTLPVEYKYRFVLINQSQYALSKGYEKRLLNTLNKTFEAIDKCTSINTFIPSPTPLCHWCNYCRNNPEAEQYKNECEYYSLWTPLNKTYEVNKKWNAIETTVDDLKKSNVNKNSTGTTRKLIF